MKERPIIFNAEMVRAILDGRKTQTRRPVKPRPEAAFRESYGRLHGSLRLERYSPKVKRDFASDGKSWLVFRDDKDQGMFCPRSAYGVPGDRLWVRETWACPRCLLCDDGLEGNICSCTDPIKYNATEGLHEGPSYPGPWTPSIHMPRWASRITLEVTDVRVERVQDISDQGATAEGWPYWRFCGACNGIVQERDLVEPDRTVHQTHPEPVEWFVGQWDPIYAKKGLGWEDNPWVWVITFKRL